MKILVRDKNAKHRWPRIPEKFHRLLVPDFRYFFDGLIVMAIKSFKEVLQNGFEKVYGSSHEILVTQSR